jgi:replication-associated recombination protein RarA
MQAGIRPDRGFRAPHHTASAIALVGGSAKPRPGEISLAHHGVLFLDELPEFNRHVLEVLREPLESGHIVIIWITGAPGLFLCASALTEWADTVTLRIVVSIGAPRCLFGYI